MGWSVRSRTSFRHCIFWFYQIFFNLLNRFIFGFHSSYRCGWRFDWFQFDRRRLNSRLFNCNIWFGWCLLLHFIPRASCHRIDSFSHYIVSRLWRKCRFGLPLIRLEKVVFVVIAFETDLFVPFGLQLFHEVTFGT